MVQTACSGAAHQRWEIPSLRADDYELLFQVEKNRIAWLRAADAGHPVPVTVDGTRPICRSADAAPWLGAVTGGRCIGRQSTGADASTDDFEGLFQAP